MNDLVEKAMDAVADLDGLELAEYWHERAKAITADLFAARAELSRLSALVAWQDIETAPRRVGLLLWNKSNGVCHGALWSKSHNEAQIAGSPRVMRPTHWMPLPGAPVSQLKDTTNADK